MQRGRHPTPSVAGGGWRKNRFPGPRGRRFARLALAAWAVGTILAGTALAQPLVATTPGGAVQAPSPDPVRAHPLEPPPGHPPAVAADPRQGERLLSGYRGCIERTVAQMAAGGGEPVRVAETAYGACRHLLALAEVEAGRRESLEQAAWSYALQTALGRMEGR